MKQEKALIVLLQEDIDTAIHAIEQAGMHMDEDEFKERYGRVYQKLHAIDRDDGSSYRVK